VTSLSINPELPKRGEIWLVNFDPTVGAEIKKLRPAVVISSDSVGKLPIKLIAPITDWKTYFSANFWHVKIEPNSKYLSKINYTYLTPSCLLPLAFCLSSLRN
jgi:mRNA interferase MazF